MIRTSVVAVLLGCLAAGLIGCQKPADPTPIAELNKDYDRPLAAGEDALIKIEPQDYPRRRRRRAHRLGDGRHRPAGRRLDLNGGSARRAPSFPWEDHGVSLRAR